MKFFSKYRMLLLVTFLASKAVLFSSEKSAIESIGAYFEKLKSVRTLQVTATADVRVDDEYYKKNQTYSTSQGYRYSYQLKYVGDYFYYGVKMHDGKDYTYSKIEGRNPIGYFLFDEKSRHLTIKNTEFVNALVMKHGHVAFLPFAFTFVQHEANPHKQLSLNDIKSDENWRQILDLFKGKIKLTKQTVSPIQVGKVLQLKSKDVYQYYFVDFDPESGFPSKWDKRSKDGTLVESYRVNKWEFPAKGLPYPKLAKLDFYEDGKPWYSISYTLDKIQVDDPLDAEEFIVDPSEASFIRDLDQEALIRVPK